MTKMSWQKLKYLENKTSFQDEMKNIFQHFYRGLNQESNTIFLGKWESGFKTKSVVSILYKWKYWQD